MTHKKTMKHKKYNKNKRNEYQRREYFAAIEIAAICNEIEKKKNQEIYKKEVLIKSHIRLDKEIGIRLFEINRIERINLWTGLRYPPDLNFEGRNWTTAYCIRKKIRTYNFPMDVMFIINQFLNWVPAGCWGSSTNIYYEKCLKIIDFTCCTGCGIKFIDSRRIGANVCSWQCYEKELRNRIIRSYEYFISSAEKMIIKIFNKEKKIVTTCFGTCYETYLDINNTVLGGFKNGNIYINYNSEYEPILYTNDYEKMINWYMCIHTPNYYEEDEYTYSLCSHTRSHITENNNWLLNNEYLIIQEEAIKKIKMNYEIDEYNDDIWKIGYKQCWND